MCKDAPKIQLAVPSSLTIETADHKIKTYKVGQVARAAAIFGVQRVTIYRDAAYDDSRFIASILQYMEAPQYLRKLL
ncbi:MAG: putative RNA uridine N3 methyltransferase, partial [Halobacteriota archaeon]